jgi:hypothetical protein
MDLKLFQQPTAVKCFDRRCRKSLDPERMVDHGAGSLPERLWRRSTCIRPPSPFQGCGPQAFEQMSEKPSPSTSNTQDPTSESES